MMGLSLALTYLVVAGLIFDEKRKKEREKK